MEQTESKEMKETPIGFKKLEEESNSLFQKVRTIRAEIDRLSNLIRCGEETKPETNGKEEARPRAENRIEEVSVKLTEYIEMAEGIIKVIYELKKNFE